jgi:23S rRNA (pseudouridine1915-N3)-methyltransferase
MKLHIITVGAPKLAYAKLGWDEYLARLRHFHTVRVTRVADKNNDAEHLLAAAAKTTLVALVIDDRQLSSPKLAEFLEQRALESHEVSFIIGGPAGLPPEVIAAAKHRWSLSALTFPHDLAMVILLETLYRASTINSGQPYHK